MYIKHDVLYQWQDWIEQLGLIVSILLGCLTVKERSHKVAEWAYRQGKENNYTIFNL